MHLDTATRLRPVKVIIIAMAGSVLVLSVIALGLIQSGTAGPDRTLASFLLAALALLAVGELPAYLVIRQSIIARLRAKGGSSANDACVYFVGPFTTLTIVGGAMTEGWGLCGAVVYLITGHPVALIGPALAALVLLAVLFPTEQRLRSFITNVTGRLT